jgi:GH25 family lysozyme M1 (1,4-beta-N-acetylmuramidase)
MGKAGIDALSPHVGSLSALDLWMPRYRPIHRLPPLPADAAGNLIFPHWTFWQHSERGAVPGIHGHVDLDLFNGNARNFTQWITSVQHHPL